MALLQVNRGRVNHKPDDEKTLKEKKVVNGRKP